MEIQKLLLEWYNFNKRNLPWRLTHDPYRIWVSEIIMQQTRVDQGLDYYQRFLLRFPDVTTLACASEEEVLSVWKGLGYYSRARNMHLTAKYVVSDLNGVFPSGYETLINMKGIGKYTAAAISSICGDEPYPVVDGNVIRVFSRLYGIQEPVGSSMSLKKIYRIAASLIPHANPGDFNQAVMEFGAIRCKPANPLCDDCLLQKGCYAYLNQLTDGLPVKKKEVLKRNRFFNYLCIINMDKKIIMQHRTGNDIWKNLWDLPMVESDHLMSVAEMNNNEISRAYLPGSFGIQAETYDFKHLLTHQNIFARYFVVKVESAGHGLDTAGFREVSDPFASGLPVSRLTERFLQHTRIMD